MSLEQRVRAYYKRHGQRSRYSYYSGETVWSRGIFMDIARTFKIPVRQVREILGKRPGKPPWPGLPKGCVHEADGYCVGRVIWYWVDGTWQSRCSTHYPGWERWTGHPNYLEITEENVQRKRGVTP